MGLSTGAMMALGMVGSTVLGSIMAPSAPSIPAAPEPSKPTPMPVSAELDPKKKARAEQSILSAGTGLSRDNTILGGSNNLLG